MEKYCKKCGKVYDDLNYKLCPFCGGELAVRYGRQPIPRKLRHEVFKRDGYRCRECGASKDETSLEIDHIVPVARGGTNDIDNLQTLCRECNRMKHTDEWVGGETDLQVAENELKNLKEQLQKAKEGLKYALTEDEKIDYQVKIMRLNEKISPVEEKISTLKQDETDRIEREIEKEKEKKRKERLFKKLYVKLNDNQLAVLSTHYGINHTNKDDIIRFLVNNNHTEKEISNLLSKHERAIKRKRRELRKQEKERLFKSLNDRIDDDFLPFLCEYIGDEGLSKTDKQETIDFLVSEYSAEKIHQVISDARIQYSIHYK